jgi:hypothetical protein
MVRNKPNRSRSQADTDADTERGCRAFFAALMGEPAAFRVMAQANGPEFVVAVCLSVIVMLVDAVGPATVWHAKRAVINDVRRFLAGLDLVA